VGAPVPLSGRYAVQGECVRAGLEAWARDYRVELVLRDDASAPQQAARICKKLEADCSFVLGPYGSDTTRAVARQAAGQVVWNHGAAADDVQRLPGVVSVPSPASRYLIALAQAVASAHPQARICVLTASGRFATFARDGLRAVAAQLGIQSATDPAAADALLLCGPVAWEIARIRRHRRPGLLIGAVSAALSDFPRLLGSDPQGLLAPVQWHPDLPIQRTLGPLTVGLDDYVAAQAYAAALIAHHCHELVPDNPLATAQHLETTTFFGHYRLGDDGLQTGHRLAVIQWRNCRRQIQSAAAPPGAASDSL
jgi:ABC-type branched-subunit amino acid transport system substrate-binding protein